MPTFFWQSPTLNVDGTRVACSANSVSVDASVDSHDVTTFCSDGWRERIGGLFDSQIDIGGFWELTDVDADLFANLGVGKPFTVAQSETVGDIAYFNRALLTSESMGGGVGDLASRDLSLPGSGRLVRGRLLQPSDTDVSAVGVAKKALTADVATITTAVAHGFTAGLKVFVDGVDATFDGTYTIKATPTPTTLTYDKVAADVAEVAATGTATEDTPTAVEHVAVADAESLYAVLHVVQTPATGTLDVIVESDDAAGFGTPVTRVTFAQVPEATRGSQWATPVAGPIADTFFRVKFTTTTGPWKFAVAIGIAAS